MLEFLGVPLIAGLVGVVSPKVFKMTDKKKIEKIFKNMGIGIPGGKDKPPSFPKFIRKEKLENGTLYVYRLPLGLSSKMIQKVQENSGVFNDGLHKKVEINFDGMLHINVYEKDIPKKWLLNEVPIQKGWKVPLGMSYKGIIWHDFDSIPHMTMGGTTRYGKTVFLKVVQTYLTLANPEDVEFYIIDLKNLEFERYKNLSQVRQVVGDPISAAEMLDNIDMEIRQTQEYFKRHYYTNIVDTPIKKRTFIIVDEAASLAPDGHMKAEEKKLMNFCQYKLSEIARLGGALGYRLVFCTQYPTGDTLPRQIKQNADAKLCFRVPTGTASDVVIDAYGAEELPSGLPGRALYKTHELKEIQVPFISDTEMWEKLAKYEKVKIVEVKEDEVIECREEETKTGDDPVILR
jgi:S-DNA-T family DNA segregation ATPase FtsK/SpoIIIE